MNRQVLDDTVSEDAKNAFSKLRITSMRYDDLNKVNLLFSFQLVLQLPFVIIQLTPHFAGEGTPGICGRFCTQADA
jgi:hypothetical protein